MSKVCEWCDDNNVPATVEVRTATREAGVYCLAYMCEHCHLKHGRDFGEARHIVNLAKCPAHLLYRRCLDDVPAVSHGAARAAELRREAKAWPSKFALDTLPRESVTVKVSA